MRVLVTGNQGYVGPVLACHLRRTYPDAEIHGFDDGFFRNCVAGSDGESALALDRQHSGDVRLIDRTLLAGFDAVVQLAAVSNDPMGHAFEAPTMAINRDASIALARACAAAGVRNFVFASSCSVYGIASGPPRTERDPVAPVTAYARSKIETEQALAELGTDMTITALRFATACGFSPRVRLDLVLNDFVAAALSEKRINVLSDGSPWRPLIDVEDMARAITWAITRPHERGGRFLVVNAGADNHNYQVREIAEAVTAALPGTELSINTDAPVDSRSYRVDFGLFAALAPDHVPQVDLAESVRRLIAGLRGLDFGPTGFRGSDFIRLKVLKDHIAAGRLDADLRWSASA